MPLSEKILRRQSACLAEALAIARDSVAQGYPADASLARWFRSHPELGSRDRRLINECLFAWFRWKGWTDSVSDAPLVQVSVARALDGLPHHDALPPAEDLVERARRQPIEALVPDWFPRCVQLENLTRLIESFQKRPPVWLRARRGCVERVISGLAALGVETTRHVASPEAVGFHGSVNLDLLRRACGSVFEVQDLASQLVGLGCAPRPGERWLDYCAASGGKSLHLADLMEGRGEIVASDIRSSSLDELRRRAHRAGVSMIRTAAPEHIEGLFDGVLVDAPCSGIGTWSRNPDARWRTSEETVHRMSDRQIEILRQASRFVKPGGTLVYAVCSITFQETRRVLASADFHPASESPLYIWPWQGPCDGMFAALAIQQ